ncbi:hypothetical protein BDZ97DRAFT_1721219, partial [Flammula alnicola]
MASHSQSPMAPDDRDQDQEPGQPWDSQPGDNSVLENADIDFPDLEPFNGAVPEDDIIGELEDVDIDVPTFATPYKLADKEDLGERRKSALTYGAEAFGRTFPHDGKTFNRRLYKDVFSALSQAMDSLLSQALKIQTLNGWAFTIKKDLYVDILRSLHKVLKDLKEVASSDGLSVPELPMWGKKGSISEVYPENEFEILAVCFRTEVEQFLTFFDQYYDFVNQRIRDLGTPIPATPERSTRDRPPHLDIISEREIRSQVSSRNSNRNAGGTITRGRRQSNFYHFGTEGPSRLKTNAQERRNINAPTQRLKDTLAFMGPSHSGSGQLEDGENPLPNTSPPRTRGPWANNNFNPLVPLTLGAPTSTTQPTKTMQAHFDVKLKFESVPTWDGNTDTLVRWLTKVNNLASMSPQIFTQLGTVVPRRFEGSAETWYWSLPPSYRKDAEKDWDSLRAAISGYYMNRRWLDKQKTRALRASYREPQHARETPNDSELILEVMEGSPANWNTILTTQLYNTSIEFQSAIRFYEDTLMRLDQPSNYSNKRDRSDYSFRDTSKPFYAARTNLVGNSKTLDPPKFPKDDSNVSSRRQTPEQAGARPCRHCGSGKHWDFECRHSYKGTKQARTNLAQSTEDDRRAQEEYDQLYYNLDSENEDEHEERD